MDEVATNQARAAGEGAAPHKWNASCAAGEPDSIELFLDRYCRSPDILRSIFARIPGRVRQLRDRDVICDIGDEATELWLVLRGQVRIESGTGTLLVTRGVGDLIGEQAPYREPSPAGRPVRGTRMRAFGDTALKVLDHAYLAALTDPERLVWAETLNRVLSAKLDDATANRTDLHRNSRYADGLLSRFVCEEGLSAARGSLWTGRIDPERCDCIIWFSDLAGFSKYAVKLSPAETGAVVHELMDVQARAIVAAGGQIDKFMGDGFMAFWRVPDESRKRAAANGALKAAIQIVEQLVALFQSRILPVDVRIGLHLGPVMLGDFGGGSRVAFTCMGQAVNTASRYEQASYRLDGTPLGRVRVSPDLWSWVTDTLIGARFDEHVSEFEDKHRVRYPVRSLRQ